MALFLAISGAFAVLVVAILIRSLRRSRPEEAKGSLSLAVLRDQKQELDAEARAGLIPESVATEQDEILAASALEEARRPAAVAATPGAAPSKGWMIAVALGVPVIAIGVYLTLGSPDLIGVELKPAPAEGHADDGELRRMVEALAAKLESNPGDAEGWRMLGRSRGALGEFATAADAFARADKLKPDDPDTLADWARAIGMAQGQRLDGRPLELIQRALAIDPKHQNALALAATEAMMRKDGPAAKRYWQQLLAVLPPDSPGIERVKGIIASLDGAAGPAAKPEAPAPADTTKAVKGTVTLAPALAARAAPNDTVFILARAENGPRVPLAVLRITVAELPRAFSLDDSQAMSPQFRISGAAAVKIEARVSKSGNAMPQPGDLRGESPRKRPGTSGVKVVIDRVVE